MALIQDTPTSIPRSNAKRAWGLLQDVKACILQEPRRVDMRYEAMNRTAEENGPPCGSVGCFAGWTVMLTSRGVENGRIVRYYDYIGEAKRLLGSCDYRVRADRARTDYHGVNHAFNNGRGDSCATTTPGTLAHAKAVVRRIDRFMRKNERRLRNKKV